MANVKMEELVRVQTVGPGGLGVYPPVPIEEVDKRSASVVEKQKVQRGANILPHPGAVSDGSVLMDEGESWGVNGATLPDPSTATDGMVLAVEDGEYKIVDNSVSTDVDDLVAPPYSTDDTYTKGQCVVYEGLLYKAKQDIDTAEAWTAEHWEETTALAEITAKADETEVSDLKTAITDTTEIVISSDNMFPGVFGITGVVNADGTFNTNSNFERSDYLPLKSGTGRKCYTVSETSAWFAVYSYKEDKTPIGNIGNGGNVSDDAAYFVIYKRKSSTGNFYVGLVPFDNDYSYSTEYKVDISNILPNSIGRNKLSNFYEGQIQYLTTGDDLNDIKVSLNLLASAGTSHTPDTGYTWIIRIFAVPWTTSLNSRYNLIEIAYRQNAIGNQYIREYDSQTDAFSDWLSMTDYIKTKINVYGLVGKKVVMMGDSTYAITGASGSRIADFLASIGECTVYNCSFGGTRLSNSRSDSYAPFDLPNLVDAIISGSFTTQESNLTGKADHFATNLEALESVDFSEIDFLCLGFGTNDFTGDVAIGDGTIDKTDFTGALAYCVDALMTEYPNLTIVVDSPRYRAWLNSEDSYAFIDDVFTHKNTLNLTTMDYINALEETSGKYGVPFNNNLVHYGWNKYNRSIYFSSTDAAHFNTTATKYAAKALCENLAKIGKSQSL